MYEYLGHGTGTESLLKIHSLVHAVRLFILAALVLLHNHKGENFKL